VNRTVFIEEKHSLLYPLSTPRERERKKKKKEIQGGETSKRSTIQVHSFVLEFS
jgi:hypothetical protein